MRLFRSMIFAGLALAACAMAVTPVGASVPIDPGIYAVTAPLDDHPAPAPIRIDKAALTCEAPEVPALASLRSSTTRSLDVAIAASSTTPVRFIELRRRC